MKTWTVMASALLIALGAAGASAQEDAAKIKGDAAAPSTAVAKDEQLLWNAIAESEHPNDFQVFLRVYPDGKYAPLARQRLATLGGRSTAQPVDAAAEPAQPVNAAAKPAQPVDAAAEPAQPLQSAAMPEIEPLEGTYVVQCNANLRVDATTKSSRLKLLFGGDDVRVTGKVKGKNWYRVESVDGKEGYVFGMLLRKEQSAAAQAAVE